MSAANLWNLTHGMANLARKNIYPSDSKHHRRWSKFGEGSLPANINWPGCKRFFFSVAAIPTGTERSQKIKC